MNRVVMVTILAVLLIGASSRAAETKVQGRIYTHWEYDMSEGAGGANSFELGRAYVTVKSSLSDYTSVRITSDLRQSTIEDDGKASTRYYVIIKYGYLDWKPAFAKGVLMLRVGLQPTPYIDFQNSLWGRRYLAKTVSDMNKFLTTADVGGSAYVGLGNEGELGSVVLSVFNGTSYASLGEANKQKDINLFAHFEPFTGMADLKESAVVAQYYRGTQNKEFNDTTKAGDYNKDIFSVGALLAYRELVHAGVDLNWLSEGQGAGTGEAKRSGVSFHGTLFLDELARDFKAISTLNLFGRYDIYDENTRAGDDKEKLLIVGLECSPTKGFKASLNVRSTSFDDGSETQKQLFVNTLFKF